jgi:hypothetical protein
MDDEGMPWLALACGLNRLLLEGRLGWRWNAVALAAKNAAAAAATRCCLCMGGLAVVEKRARSLFMLSVSNAVSRCHALPSSKTRPQKQHCPVYNGSGVWSEGDPLMSKQDNNSTKHYAPFSSSISFEDNKQAPCFSLFCVFDCLACRELELRAQD